MNSLRFISQCSFALALFFSIGFSGCSNKTSSNAPKANFEESYSGVLNIDADPGLEPIMRQLKEVFESYHDSVKVNIAYKNEAEMFADFKNKKAGVLLLTREVSDAEDARMKLDTVYISQLRVAYDAVALIGNPQFNDSQLDTNQLKKFFDPALEDVNSPQLIFDNGNSSVVREVLERFALKQNASPKVSGLKSNAAVIDYVANSKNAIGFIPFILLSDTYDDSVKARLSRIKILSLRAKDESGKMIAVSANQSDIATGAYPLKRTINTITHYGHEDVLSLVFINFLSGEKGARIFLKAGLVPIHIPSRDINVNTDGLKGIN